MFIEQTRRLISLMKQGIITEKEMLNIVEDLSKDIPESDDILFNKDLFFELTYYKDVLGYAVYQGYCGNDEEIYIPETYRGLPVIYIPEEAFAECSNLHEIFLPDNLIGVGDNAFADCQELTGIVFPNNVKYIGTGVCSGCLRLEHFVLPKDLEYIGEDVLECCDSLKSIHIPASLIEVPDFFCDRLQGLSTAFLEDGLQVIGYSAFSRCYSLWKVEIPASIRKIEKDAFSQCENLNQIVYKGTYEDWLKIEKSEAWNRDTPSISLKCIDKSVTIKVGESYLYSEQWLKDRLRCNPHELMREQIIKRYLENIDKNN